jgi:hypothetical protein
VAVPGSEVVGPLVVESRSTLVELGAIGSVVTTEAGGDAVTSGADDDSPLQATSAMVATATTAGPSRLMS